MLAVEKDQSLQRCCEWAGCIACVGGAAVRGENAGESMGGNAEVKVDSVQVVEILLGKILSRQPLLSNINILLLH